MTLATHKLWLTSLALVSAFGYMLNASAASTISGTYIGPYSGDEAGTLTIVIDDSNNVTCDFYSTAKLTHYVLTGDVVEGGESTSHISCDSTDSTYLWSAEGDDTTGGGGTISGTWANSLGGVIGTGNFSTLYSSDVTILPATFSPAAVTGLWYDQAYVGSGLNLLMSSSAGLLITYYGWDAGGNRMWLSSDTGHNPVLGSPVTFNMGYSTGGTFNNPQHNAAPWGTLVLTFTNCTSATAVLSGTDGTQNLNLQMLVGSVGVPGCQ